MAHDAVYGEGHVSNLGIKDFIHIKAMPFSSEQTLFLLLRVAPETVDIKKSC